MSSYVGSKSTETNKESLLNIRFVAASATIPNAEDIAEWLSTKDNLAVCHKYVFNNIID